MTGTRPVTTEAMLEALVEDLTAELSRVRRELDDARFALACAVRAAGGRIEVPRSVLAGVPQGAETARKASHNGAVVFTVA